MKLYRPQRKYGSQINIAPLIDVVFLLIIFAMLVSEFTKVQAEDVKLPQARSAQKQPAGMTGRLVVNVLSDHRIIVERQTLTLDMLRARLAKYAAQPGDQKSILIRVDRKATWPRVKKVMQAFAQNRLIEVNVAVLEPDDAGSTENP
jgi:biopolymer transport protein ExbD